MAKAERNADNRSDVLSTNVMLSTLGDDSAVEDTYFDDGSYKALLNNEGGRSDNSRMTFDAKARYSHNGGRRVHPRKTGDKSRRKVAYTRLDQDDEQVTLVDASLPDSADEDNIYDKPASDSPAPFDVGSPSEGLPPARSRGRGSKAGSRSRCLWWVSAITLLALVAAIAAVGLVASRDGGASASHAALVTTSKLTLRMDELESLVAAAMLNVTSSTAETTTLTAEAAALRKELETSQAQATMLNKQLKASETKATVVEAAFKSAEEKHNGTETALAAALRVANQTLTTATKAAGATEESATYAQTAAQVATVSISQLEVKLNATIAAVATLAVEGVVTAAQLANAVDGSKVLPALLVNLVAECPQGGGGIPRQMLQVTAEGNVVCAPL